HGISRLPAPERRGTVGVPRPPTVLPSAWLAPFGAPDPVVSAFSGGVTIILPVRNEAGYIRRAIRSVQTAARGVEDVEILVIDGMSDDDTADIVRSMAKADPRITLLENPHRTVPQGMNLAIRASRGDVI